MTRGGKHTWQPSTGKLPALFIAADTPFYSISGAELSPDIFLDEISPANPTSTDTGEIAGDIRFPAG